MCKENSRKFVLDEYMQVYKGYDWGQLKGVNYFGNTVTFATYYFHYVLFEC